jgi:uncharacterized protein YggE
MAMRAACAVLTAVFVMATGCATSTPAQPPAGAPPPAAPHGGPPPGGGHGMMMGHPPLITVSATGKASVRPDVAIAMLGAEGRAPKLADATGDVARRMTAVIAQIKGLGVADRDVQTLAYTIEPLYAPRRPGEEEMPPRIAGYRATNVVQVKIRTLESVGRVLDAAVAAGANTIRNLSFAVDDPSRAEAEARAQAVKNAAAKARQLADAAGVRLGDLAFLNEGAAQRPIISGRVAFATAAMAPGPVESGEQEISVTVEAHYRMAR